MFVKQPEDVTGNSGERVTLECLVDSNPPGRYTWLRNSLVEHTKVSSKELDSEEKELVKLNPILLFDPRGEHLDQEQSVF